MAFYVCNELVQNGPHQCPPSTSTAFSLMELSHGGFAVQINLWRASIHFTNSPVYLLFFYSVCSYIGVSTCVRIHTYTHIHICVYVHLPSSRASEGSSRSLTTVSAGASHRSVSPESLLLALVKNHRFHWLQMLFISHWFDQAKTLKNPTTSS